jgi:hypothetical protein
MGRRNKIKIECFVVSIEKLHYVSTKHNFVIVTHHSW